MLRDDETTLSIRPINHNHRLSSQHKLNLWFLQSNIDFFPPASLPINREHYFASAAWVSQTEVSVVWMNRAQNLSVVTLCKSPMWYCQEVREMAFHVSKRRCFEGGITMRVGWVREVKIALELGYFECTRKAIQSNRF